METEFAPAKINLTLHITGQRPDGYHLVDSLVCFADAGDVVSAGLAEDLTLTVTGRYADALGGTVENLVIRAARLLRSRRGAAITLDKRLPVASGIGGGSSDAAATLRMLARLWGIPLPDPRRLQALGSDVPVCMARHGARMSGTGGTLAPVFLPEAWIVLANPGVSLPTPSVFRVLTERQNPPMPAELPRFDTVQTLAGFLGAMRNDLETAAIGVAPVIGTVLAALQHQPGGLISRMTGSGATCFALFGSEAAAVRAAQEVQKSYPLWWVQCARMLRA